MTSFVFSEWAGIAGRIKSELPLTPEAWPLVVTPRSGAEDDGARNASSEIGSTAVVRSGAD